MLLDSLNVHSKKIALIGDSAVGKTTAIGTLANAGFEVGILDVDNGYAVLSDPLRVKPENRKNVHLEHVDITDDRGWEQLGKALNGSWDGWGPVGSWGKSRVFCLDSGSIATKMVFRHVCNWLNSWSVSATISSSRAVMARNFGASYRETCLPALISPVIGYLPREPPAPSKSRLAMLFTPPPKPLAGFFAVFIC